jgi:hypothetical protein
MSANYQILILLIDLTIFIRMYSGFGRVHELR